MAEVTAVNIDELEQWIGREEVLTDQITLTPIRALAAVLGRRETAISERRCDFAMLALAYFLPLHRQSEIGSDGHPRRGGFLPPVPLPRRMWAGSALEFRRPLRVGETVTRTIRIVDVSSKEGRSGSLVFVKVRHEIADSSNNAAVVEARDAGGRSAAVPVFGSDTFARERIPTPRRCRSSTASSRLPPKVAWARCIGEALAGQPELGVIAIDGKVVDRPHVRMAERLLARL